MILRPSHSLRTDCTITGGDWYRVDSQSCQNVCQINVYLCVEDLIGAGKSLEFRIGYIRDFDVILKSVQVMVCLHIFLMFSFLAQMLSFLSRYDNIFARNEISERYASGL